MIEIFVLALEIFDISATELLFLQACKNCRVEVFYPSEDLDVT